jgi:hypothetical protein
MGWFGLKQEMIYTLKSMRADLDEQGNIKLYGEPPAIGFGGEEVVVPDGCDYSVGGDRRSVAGALGATSYGLRGIKVF